MNPFRIRSSRSAARPVRRVLTVCLLIFFGVPNLAQAAPTINVGNFQAVPIAAATSLDVFVTGGDLINGEDLYISIANQHAGTMYGDPTPAGEPLIANVDIITGTPWASNNTGQRSLTTSDQIWEVDTTTAAGTVSASGKLFTITLNTLGVAPGSTWALRVLAVSVPALGLGPFDSVYDTTSSTANRFAGTNGTFTLVPEPSSIVLGLLGAAGLGALAIRRRAGSWTRIRGSRP